MLKKEIHLSEKYSMKGLPIAPAVIAKPFVFVSGQGPYETINKDIKAQTREVLERIKGILEECGTSINNVLKMTVYLSDMNNYQAMNEIFSEFFKKSPPARTCIEVSRIPRDALIEIDAIALIT